MYVFCRRRHVVCKSLSDALRLWRVRAPASYRSAWQLREPSLLQSPSRAGRVRIGERRHCRSRRHDTSARRYSHVLAGLIAADAITSKRWYLIRQARLTRWEDATSRKWRSHLSVAEAASAVARSLHSP